MTAPRVLFVCTHNAGRSALAAALARTYAGTRLLVESAGVTPDASPNPVTIASLAEIGIDDSGHPVAVTDEQLRQADVVIAMKPGLNLARHPDTRYETWTLPDPGGWDIDLIRPLRDHINRRVQALLTSVPRHVYPGGRLTLNRA